MFPNYMVFAVEKPWVSADIVSDLQYRALIFKKYAISFGNIFLYLLTYYAEI